MLLSFQNSQVEQVRVAAAPHQSHLLEPKSPNWGPKLPCLKNVKLSRRGFFWNRKSSALNWKLKWRESAKEREPLLQRIGKGESPCCDEHPIFTAAMASQIGTAVQWGLSRKKFHIQNRVILVILFYVAHKVFLRPQPVKIWGERPSNNYDNRTPFSFNRTG